MTIEGQDNYQVSDDTTVGEALFVVPGAAEIFKRHGCEAEFECTQEHFLEYVLLDTRLTCHIDNTDALIADLNSALAAEKQGSPS